MASEHRLLSRRQLISASVALATMSILASCDKKGGDAVVLAKEHIAARAAPKSEATASPSPTPAKESETYRELRKDEIAVDQYVMRGVDRGISRDPRAADDEQWIVKVQMVYDLRKIDIYAEKEQFEKVKEGDRIKVTYRLGKYTGTVWGAAIR